MDSQAAIKKLKGFSDHSHRAKALCNTLIRLDCTIFIYWCPSHIGIIGNEIADKLAKKGLQAKPSIETFTLLSYLCYIAKESYISNWKAD